MVRLPRIMRPVLVIPVLLIGFAVLVIGTGPITGPASVFLAMRSPRRAPEAPNPETP